MKKIILIFIILYSVSTINVFAQDEDKSVLKKYLVPAKITKLDWILLKIEVSSFDDRLSWDNFGLIQDISLYSIEGGPLIGMTFVVNKNKYLKLENTIIKKTFKDVVDSAFRIIKIRLPEIELEKDIYANFVTDDVIAEFKKGNINLKD